MTRFNAAPNPPGHHAGLAVNRDLKIVVFRVEVGRCTFTVAHVDHNSKKPTQLWRGLIPIVADGAGPVPGAGTSSRTKAEPQPASNRAPPKPGRVEPRARLSRRGAALSSIAFRWLSQKTDIDIRLVNYSGSLPGFA